jgi:hypothetical protein
MEELHESYIDHFGFGGHYDARVTNNDYHLEELDQESEASQHFADALLARTVTARERAANVCVTKAFFRDNGDGDKQLLSGNFRLVKDADPALVDAAMKLCIHDRLGKLNDPDIMSISQNFRRLKGITKKVKIENQLDRGVSGLASISPMPPSRMTQPSSSFASPRRPSLSFSPKSSSSRPWQLSDTGKSKSLAKTNDKKGASKGKKKNPEKKVIKEGDCVILPENTRTRRRKALMGKSIGPPIQSAIDNNLRSSPATLPLDDRQSPVSDIVAHSIEEAVQEESQKVFVTTPELDEGVENAKINSIKTFLSTLMKKSKGPATNVLDAGNLYGSDNKIENTLEGTIASALKRNTTCTPPVIGVPRLSPLKYRTISPNIVMRSKKHMDDLDSDSRDFTDVSSEGSLDIDPSEVTTKSPKIFADELMEACMGDETKHQTDEGRLLSAEYRQLFEGFDIIDFNKDGLVTRNDFVKYLGSHSSRSAMKRSDIDMLIWNLDEKMSGAVRFHDVRKQYARIRSEIMESVDEFISLSTDRVGGDDSVLKQLGRKQTESWMFLRILMFASLHNTDGSLHLLSALEKLIETFGSKLAYRLFTFIFSIYPAFVVDADTITLGEFLIDLQARESRRLRENTPLSQREQRLLYDDQVRRQQEDKW